MADDKKVEQEQNSTIAQLESLLPVGDHEEEVSVDGKKEIKKGIYILPNLFTTGALFSGFYAVIAAMQNHLEAASVAIIIAMILDSLDGRIARLINAQSAFGAEYDSLADMISFGLAPAIVMFQWSLDGLGKVGWAIAFIYVACAAVRLARFNTQKADKNYFTGLASPAAAITLACVVWLSADFGWLGQDIPGVLVIVSAILTLFTGLLMVSNVRYQSFKGIDVKARVPLIVLILIIALFAVVLISPPAVILFMISVYVLSGPVLTVLSKKCTESAQ